MIVYITLSLIVECMTNRARLYTAITCSLLAVFYRLWWLYIIDYDIRLDTRRYSFFLLGTAWIWYSSQRGFGKRKIYTDKILYAAHIAIWSFFFFQYVLDIPGIIAVLLVVLFCVLILGIQVSKWRRIILILPSSIGIVLAIGFVLLPSYNTIPSLEQFYDSFGIKLHIVVRDVPAVMRDVDADIIVRSTNQNPNQQTIIPINTPITTHIIRRPSAIEFASNKVLYNTFAFLQFYDGEIVPIPTQSTIYVSYTDTGYMLQSTGIQLEQTKDRAANFLASEIALLQEQYKQAYRYFILEYIWGERTQHAYIRAVHSYILDRLSRFLPEYYAQVYANYQEVQSMLHIDNATQPIRVEEQPNISRRDLLHQGLMQTRLFGER